jgi:DNA-binding GntR family transcriptional regulator
MMLLDRLAPIHHDNQKHETATLFFTLARCEADAFPINLAWGLMLTRLLRRVQTDHVMLFQVIETGDMEGVRAAVRKHIESTRKRVFKGLGADGSGTRELEGSDGFEGRRLAANTHN